VRLGGPRYVGFAAPAGLTDRDLAHLANLSSVYGLFEVVGDPAAAGTAGALARFDDDLITIPKYAGKTNEQFTKLLLNLTLLASARAPRMLDGPVTVLDPLCGRGTTLNQALMYGYDAIGIERDGKDIDAYAAFLRTWLRRKRLKHQADLHPVRRDRRLVARCFRGDDRRPPRRGPAGRRLPRGHRRGAGVPPRRLRRRDRRRRALRRGARQPHTAPAACPAIRSPCCARRYRYG